MADISQKELREEITAILKDADLNTTSAKKVRQQIEKKLDIDLSDRKKEVDDLVMECLQEKQNENNEDEDEEEEEEEEEDEESEEEKKPKKRGAVKKPTKRKKGSDSESEEEDEASDEEYSPKKKTSPKKGAKGAKKAKGSDDSDDDWKQPKKKAAAPKKAAGGKKGGGGFTKVLNLSPELAAVVGAESMARHEVVKKVWAIIKERNLYDPKNKQFAICDDQMMKVFKVKRFRTFGMMKYLKDHFVA